MSGGSCLLDSNILLRWVQPNSPDYAIIVAALDGLVRDGTTLCYTSQNIGEFWNACTRPADRNGYGLSPEETDRRVRILERHLHLLPDVPPVHQEWRKLIVAHAVCGVQVHDARLVAAMCVHGVKRILTFDGKDFVRFTEIQAVSPREVLARQM